MNTSRSGGDLIRARLSARAGLLLGVAAACLAASPALAQDDAGAVEEIVVTGTSIRGAQPVGSNLVTIGREDITAISAPSTADLLTKVPQLTAFSNIPRITTSNAGANTPPGLRALPASATLTLIDGFRMVGGAPLNSVPDPSSIPAAAIERVEIVADGASAIYGSDAVAGVINIITRKNLNGLELTARYGTAQYGYFHYEASAALGHTWATGSAMGVLYYTQHNSFAVGQTDFYTNDLRPFGGIDLRGQNCFPANIRIGTTVYAQPNYAPAANSSDRCDFGALASNMTDNRRTSFIGNINQSLGEKARFNGLFEYSATYDNNRSGPGSQTLTIPSTNPFFQLPPGVTATSETVLYNTVQLFGGDAPVNRFYNKHGLLAGNLEYDLPADWRIVASGSYGWSDNLARNPGINAAAIAAAAAATSASTALDPFGGRTNPAVAAVITDWETRFFSEQAIYDAQLKADGPLFTLPGGEAKLAVGLNYRKNSYDAVNPIGPVGADPGEAVVSASRKLKSGFAEVFLPFVGPENAMPGVQELNLSMAIRHDDYSDVGKTTNPKIGLTWSPVSDLTLRGSFGKSFHAPDLADLFAVDTRVIYNATDSTVPPGRQPGPSIVIAGGNPQLKPETAKTYSAGAEFEPSALPGFRASVTYYDITYDNQIRTPPLNATLYTNDAFRAFWYADPTSAQVEEITAGMRVVNAIRPIPTLSLIRDLRRQNLASTKTDGIDFSVAYSTAVAGGDLRASVDGNKIFSFATQGGAGQPFVPDITVAKWRVRGGLLWRSGPFRADAAFNYLGSFQNSYGTPAGATAIQKVKAFKTVDLGVSYELDSLYLLRGATVSLRVENVFNAEPPLQLFATGYSAQASPLGRMFWATISTKL